MCKRYEDQLPFYVAGTLPPATTSAIERHLQHCASCRQALADWRLIARRVQSASNRRALGPPSLTPVLTVITQSPTQLAVDGDDASGADAPGGRARPRRRRTIGWLLLVLLLGLCGLLTAMQARLSRPLVFEAQASTGHQARAAIAGRSPDRELGTDWMRISHPAARAIARQQAPNLVRSAPRTPTTRPSATPPPPPTVSPPTPAPTIAAPLAPTAADTAITDPSAPSPPMVDLPSTTPHEPREEDRRADPSATATPAFGVITGQVLGPDGAGRAEIVVVAETIAGGQEPVTSSLTDVTGAYSITLPAGKWIVHVDTPAYRPQWYDQKASPSEATPVDIQPGVTVPGIDFRLVPQAEVLKPDNHVARAP